MVRVLLYISIRRRWEVNAHFNDNDLLLALLNEPFNSIIVYALS